MKPFNLSIAVILILIFLGFVFFKDSLIKVQGEDDKPKEVLMDRMNYIDYSQQNLNFSQKHGQTVLFFAATTWCTTCSALDKEIKQSSNLLPADITILKVDYDLDKQTRNAYGVTTQHTLVELDKDGKELKRWVGGNFDVLLQEVSEI